MDMPALINSLHTILKITYKLSDEKYIIFLSYNNKMT